MAVLVYQPTYRRIAVFVVSLYYGTFITLGLIWKAIAYGPSKVFGRKKRLVRPAVLDDPQHGTHHYANLKNIQLHYVANGPEDRPLMLFLHGFPEFWYSWRHQLKEFSKDYRVVAVDMRGFGESGRPNDVEDYHMSKLTDDINDFIDHLGYKKCTLVAHDWGGFVAYYVAAKYPDCIEKLIVCNVPHLLAYEKHFQRSWTQFRKAWYIFPFQLPWLAEIFLLSDDHLFLKENLCDTITSKHPERMTAEDVEAYKYTFQHYNDYKNPLGYYRALWRYQPERLPDIKVQAPTMIIWGTADRYLDRAMVEMSTKYVKNECTIRYIENCSHWVQQEEPEQVNRYMREFLQ